MGWTRRTLRGVYVWTLTNPPFAYEATTPYHDTITRRHHLTTSSRMAPRRYGSFISTTLLHAHAIRKTRKSWATGMWHGSVLVRHKPGRNEKMGGIYRYFWTEWLWHSKRAMIPPLHTTMAIVSRPTGATLFLGLGVLHTFGGFARTRGGGMHGKSL